MRINVALGETREALGKRDAALANERAERLKMVLQEAGKTIYAQAPEAAPQPKPDVGTPSAEARPTGAAPGGRVVDAEYREAQEGNR